MHSSYEDGFGISGFIVGVSLSSSESSSLLMLWVDEGWMEEDEFFFDLM